MCAVIIFYTAKISSALRLSDLTKQPIRVGTKCDAVAFKVQRDGCLFSQQGNHNQLVLS